MSTIRDESVQELLDVIVTIVSERRHKHSQCLLAAEQAVADATFTAERERAARAGQVHRRLLAEYESLLSEIEEVIAA